MTLRRRSAGGGDDSQADRRMEQREKYPVLLGAEEKSVVPGADPVSDIRTFGFTVVGETAILLQLATESSKSEKLCFNRFERLQVFNILFYQHRPMEIDEHVEQSSGELPDDLTNEGLANLLHNYCRSGISQLGYLKDNGSYATPDVRIRRIGSDLARKLHEPHYWDSPDALNWVKTGVDSPLGSPGVLRGFLQKWLPERLPDEAGKDRRYVDQRRAEGSLTAGVQKATEAFELQTHHTSPVTDVVARSLIAISGGIFLLVPMVVLTIVQAVGWPLLATVLFVVLFALSIALMTKASNYELLAATAAYAAVLVVFVGNGPGHGLRMSLRRGIEAIPCGFEIINEAIQELSTMLDTLSTVDGPARVQACQKGRHDRTAGSPSIYHGILSLVAHYPNQRYRRRYGRPVPYRHRGQPGGTWSRHFPALSAGS